MATTFQNGLFHYTTLDGLLGILRDKCLFASDVRFLNDRSEFNYGFALFKEVFRKIKLKVEITDQKDPDANQVSMYEARVSSYINDLINKLEEHVLKLNHVYCASFCKASNEYEYNNGLLSQWRGYGTDGGVVIEFEREAFSSYIQSFFSVDNLTGFSLKEVFYPERSEAVGEYLQSEKQYFSEVAFNMYNKDVAQVAQHLKGGRKFEDFRPEMFRSDADDNAMFWNMFSSLARIPALIKHPAFFEEKEVRLLIWGASLGEVVLLRKKQEFRMNKKLLTPFIRIGNEKLPIARIIVGPHPEQERRTIAIAACAKAHGHSVDVLKSTTPLSVS
jgi:hypothetical protein